jgi:hypothetical protein
MTLFLEAELLPQPTRKNVMLLVTLSKCCLIRKCSILKTSVPHGSRHSDPSFGTDLFMKVKPGQDSHAFYSYQLTENSE